MLILKTKIFLHKCTCFAKRKYRLLKFGALWKLRKLVAIEQPKPFAKGFSLPRVLKTLPFIDAKITNIPIRNVLAPYNASIIEHGQNYLLFFRYDTIVENAERPYTTNIGCVELDNDFKQTDKEFIRIETKSRFSEDPRVIKSENQLFLSYNDFLPHNFVRRSIHLASLHPKTLATEYITNLHIDKKPVEKNWAPFFHENVLHFDYYLTPRQVLKIPNPQVPDVQTLEKCWQQFPWPHKWGFPRGGTPPRQIGNEYLSFFHSSFENRKGVSWYVMAAYTFEAKPPFRITAISRHPILFEGIYSSPILNTARLYQRAVFPAGFIIENGKIHISLGENDSAVKILTLNLEDLLKSLKKIL